MSVYISPFLGGSDVKKKPPLESSVAPRLAETSQSRLTSLSIMYIIHFISYLKFYRLPLLKFKQATNLPSWLVRQLYETFHIENY